MSGEGLKRSSQLIDVAAEPDLERGGLSAQCRGATLSDVGSTNHQPFPVYPSQEIRKEESHDSTPVIDESPSQELQGTTPRHDEAQASTLDAALSYAARGWSVFPLHSVTKGRCSCRREECPSSGKHPRTQHGLRDATKNEETIRGRWEQWPNANVGVVTGEFSGLLVLDIYTRSGGDRSFQQLETEHGCLPQTLECPVPE